MDADEAKKEWKNITNDHADCPCGGNHHCGGSLSSMWRELGKDHFNGPCEHQKVPCITIGLEDARSEVGDRSKKYFSIGTF